MRLFAVSLVLLLVAGFQSAALAQLRVVSINQCADELLLSIARREQLVSVSHFVKDPRLSWSADLAAHIPGNGGRSEEVVAHRPDLVFAGEYNDRATFRVLKSLGLSVVSLPHPARIEDVANQMLTVQMLVETTDEYDALLERVLALKARLANPPADPVRAVVYQPNGFTTGRGSLVDELLVASGFTNVAADLEISGYGQFPLEALLAAQPELVVLDRQALLGPSLAQAVLDHPVLRQVATIEIPPQAWACGSPHILRAADLLSEARTRLREAS